MVCTIVSIKRVLDIMEAEENYIKAPARKPSVQDYTSVAVINFENLNSPSSLISSKKHAVNIVKSARMTFNSGKTKSVKFRKQQLKNLLRMVDENKKAIHNALNKDLGRHLQESDALEVEHVRNSVIYTLDRLHEWVKPKSPPKPIVNILDGIRIANDPYGVVLIMSPWNVPFELTFVPLIGAIAAGNCVILKPSEISEATTKLISDLVSKYLDKDCYQVYLGGVTEMNYLFEERFDYIFFSGSTQVGKIVHAAANKYLTPVTLELGGKNPVYIDKSADMEKTVRRILWAKCTNAGQICIAPDYILCSKEVQEKFVSVAANVLKEWYGNDVQASSSYGRIISGKHYSRLLNLLNNNKKIIIGGKSDASDRFIEPTILIDVSPNDIVMQEEIFGPILPIITVNNDVEAVNFIKAREKPLVIYLFTKDKNIISMFETNTSSGTLSVNETIFYAAVDALPFGGVGFSGMGAYHGKYSFETFVHKKSVFVRGFGSLLEKCASLRYPPYSEKKVKYINIAMRPRMELSSKYVALTLMFLLGCLCITLIQVAYAYVTNKHLF